jgi:thiol-disulfide isomerase/thioredoxin
MSLGDGALRLGPLLLPYTLLLVLVALGVTLAVGRLLARRAAGAVDGGGNGAAEGAADGAADGAAARTVASGAAGGVVGGVVDGVAGAVESALWRTLLVGFVVARLAFVHEYRALYLPEPLRILDIRDGGWNAGVGLVAGWLYALYRQQRQPVLRRPLRFSLLAGTLVFLAGTAVLTLRGHTDETLPDLALATVEGEPVRLSSFAGRPVVVNLWATWCPPCVREMPMFQRAQGLRPDVHFVFLNQGEDPAAVRRWLQGRGLTLRNVLVDERFQASAAFKRQGYPTTLFFDDRGRLVGRRIGELSAATLEEQLQRAAR